jgi:hypothetical protein
MTIMVGCFFSQTQSAFDGLGIIVTRFWLRHSDKRLDACYSQSCKMLGNNQLQCYHGNRCQGPLETWQSPRKPHSISIVVCVAVIVSSKEYSVLQFLYIHLQSYIGANTGVKAHFWKLYHGPFLNRSFSYHHVMFVLCDKCQTSSQANHIFLPLHLPLSKWMHLFVDTLHFKMFWQLPSYERRHYRKSQVTDRFALLGCWMLSHNKLQLCHESAIIQIWFTKPLREGHRYTMQCIM